MFGKDVELVKVRNKLVLALNTS